MSTKPLGWPWVALTRPALAVDVTSEEEREARRQRALAVEEVMALAEREIAAARELEALEQVERGRGDGEPC